MERGRRPPDPAACALLASGQTPAAFADIVAHTFFPALDMAPPPFTAQNCLPAYAGYRSYQCAMSSHVLGHHNVVVDSCWTLLPLFTLSAMLAAMVNKNSALFYVAFMDEFGVSHQAASWPITMHGVVTHLTGT
ncbi:hypothetical protein HPB52_006116 [Rhipicephalus sanguineus]|uniref:Uncharacterized protein n=1 Tax=Rhipicephalus sanguineus TaxID=34632 RepID=A0A9D4T8P4_RHISA|nr:hypothetical protein HPB52_006116 [Rhipicephalus sanguineus]